jgi:hypothetical protein
MAEVSRRTALVRIALGRFQEFSLARDAAPPADKASSSSASTNPMRGPLRPRLAVCGIASDGSPSRRSLSDAIKSRIASFGKNAAQPTSTATRDTHPPRGLQTPILSATPDTLFRVAAGFAHRRCARFQSTPRAEARFASLSAVHPAPNDAGIYLNRPVRALPAPVLARTRWPAGPGPDRNATTTSRVLGPQS